MSKAGRTEKPTPKRIKEARKDGKIARSPEVSSWGLLFVLGYVGPYIFHYLTPYFLQMVYGWENLRASSLTAGLALNALFYGLRTFIYGTAIVAGVGFVVAFATTVGQSGVAINWKNVLPKTSRLSVIGNVKKVVSPNSLFELGKSILKLVITAGVGWMVVKSQVMTLASGQLSLSEAVTNTVDGSLALVRTLSLVGLALGIMDFFHQRYRLIQSLYMTKQEIKDEMREMDGDPLVKARIRRLQRQLSRSRMMAAVSEADVVVVNPTHYAVAIAYRPGTHGAPVVVAKGTGYVAQKIREVAESSSVPVVRDVVLARTLYAGCKVGTQIPATLFVAVAKLLAFVYQLSQMARYYETNHSTKLRDLPEDLLEKVSQMT